MPTSLRMLKCGWHRVRAATEGERGRKREERESLAPHFCHYLNSLVITRDVEARPDSALEPKAYPDYLGPTLEMPERAARMYHAQVGKMCPPSLACKPGLCSNVTLSGQTFEP